MTVGPLEPSLSSLTELPRWQLPRRLGWLTSVLRAVRPRSWPVPGLAIPRRLA
jgi:hypothetical protein